MKNPFKRGDKVEEAYSSAAYDMATGHDVAAMMLRCMQDEVDDPEQLALMQKAYDFWMQWLSAEATEVGTAEDLSSSMFEAGNGTVAFEGEIIPLIEKAVRRDGTIPIRVIKPGWGSTGYYSKSVLEKDAPKAFPAGTKMYWDHPTQTEEVERPERSLNELAAELVGPAMYKEDGSAGPGVYADAKVFEGFQRPVDELASHIGVSIRAPGRATTGVAEGRRGPIIESILAAKTNSIDFVTLPGAGGQIVSLFESFRPTETPPASAGGSVAAEEADVSDEKEIQTLREAQTASEAARVAAETARDEALREAARAKEALILRDAQSIVEAELAKIQIPDVTRVRLRETLAKNPPVVDGKLDVQKFQESIVTAVKAEVAYLAQATGSGQVVGMGSAATPGSTALSEADAKKAIESGFRTLGLSESAAKAAALGRD